MAIHQLIDRRWIVRHREGSIEVISAEKGGMIRRIGPIHDAFAAELETIIHYRKKPVKRIQTTWKNTLTRGKIKRRLRPYDLRHNFITAALEEGADIGAVAAIV